MSDQVPARFALAAAPGFGGGDLRFTNLNSRKDCRMSATERQPHRLKTKVRPTGGLVHADMTRATIKPRAKRTVRKADWQPTAGTIWEVWRAHAR